MEEDQTRRTEADAVAEIAGRNARPFVETVEGPTGQQIWAFLPSAYGGWNSQLMDGDKGPIRVEQSPAFDKLTDLCAYTKRFMTSSTVAFADGQRRCVQVVIDYHTPNLCEVDRPTEETENRETECIGAIASHTQHTPYWMAQFDPYFAAWHDISGRYIGQTDFVRFLEEQAHMIVQPEAADVMEVAKNLDVIQTVKFKSQTRLQDGTRQVMFMQENDEKGALKVPERLELRCPIFFGQDPQPVTVLLRYSIDEGRLKFKIELHRIEEALDAAWTRCVNQMQTEAPGLPVYRGALTRGGQSR